MASLTQQVAKNTFFSFLTSLITRLGGFVFIIILTKLLLPELFGTLTLALSIALIFMTFSDLGINSALVRYASDALAKNNKKKAKAYYNYLLKVKLLLTLIISLLILVLAYPLSYFVFKKSALFIPLLASSLYVFFGSLSSFFEAVFYTVKKVKFLVIKEFLFEILKISLIFPFLLLFNPISYPLASVLFLSLIIAIFLFFIYYYAKKNASFLLEKSDVEIDKKKILKFIFYLSIGSITIVFYSYIGSLMIGSLIPDVSYVGFYSISFSLAFGVASLLTFSNVFLQAFTEARKKKIKAGFDKAIKYSFMLTIPAAIGLSFFSKYFISLFFRPEYIQAAPLLAILSFSIILAVAISILVTIFSAKEKPQIYVKFLVISTILNIILNYLLISQFLKISQLMAAAGAAIATTLAGSFYLVSLFILAKKHFSLSPKLSFILKPLAASLVMLLALFLMNHFIKTTLLTGALEIVSGAIIYFLALTLLKGINKEDLKIIMPFRSI